MPNGQRGGGAQRVLGFYNSNGRFAKINYDSYKKAVSKINN